MNKKKKEKTEKSNYFHHDGWSTKKKTLTMDYDRGGVRPTWV